MNLKRRSRDRRGARPPRALSLAPSPGTFERFVSWSRWTSHSVGSGRASAARGLREGAQTNARGGRVPQDLVAAIFVLQSCEPLPPRRRFGPCTGILPMNLVAADVRRLMQHWAKEIRASSRRLLLFRGSKRETSVRRNLSPALSSISWKRGSLGDRVGIVRHASADTNHSKPAASRRSENIRVHSWFLNRIATIDHRHAAH